MKTLAELGTNRELMAEAIAALNACDKSDGMKIDVANGSDELLLQQFLAVSHTVPATETNELPEVTKAFYSSLPQVLFDEFTTDEEKVVLKNLIASQGAIGESAGGAVEGTTSECPSFGNQNMDEIDCQECKEQFPDEFASCTAKSTAGKGKKGKGTKAPKAPKEPKAPKAPKAPKEPKAPKAPKPPKEKVVKEPAKRSRYGHVVGSMSGDIDNMVWTGMHIDTMAATLAAKHGKDIAAARSKIRGHVNWLIQNKNVTVIETEGVLKANVEFAAGWDAANTITTDIPNTEAGAPEVVSEQPVAAE